MKVENMKSSNGNKVANQFIITDDDGNKTFQSYTTVIAKKEGDTLILDTNALDYSKTTSKYLYSFTGMDRKELQAMIKSGKVVVRDLN